MNWEKSSDTIWKVKGERDGFAGGQQWHFSNKEPKIGLLQCHVAWFREWKETTEIRQYDFVESPSLETLLPVFPTPDWPTVVELDRIIQSWCEDHEGQKTQPGSRLSNLSSVENRKLPSKFSLQAVNCKFCIGLLRMKKRESVLTFLVKLLCELSLWTCWSLKSWDKLLCFETCLRLSGVC